jgi:CRP/FNR family transcriptional regulator, cyclic AMP receptor protein
MVELLKSEYISFFFSKKITTYQRGELIFSPKDNAFKVYYIHSGQVKFFNEADVSGRMIIKAVFEQGDFLGIESVLGCKERKNYAQALGKVNLGSMLTMDFLKLFTKDRYFRTYAFAQVGKRILDVEEKIKMMSHVDSRSRVVNFLKKTAKENGKKIGVEIKIDMPFTHYEIGCCVGVCRQTVTSTLRDLKKKNKIYYNSRYMLIRDVEKLF